MPADMKAIISQAAVRLIQKGNRKRITVKDIVEECHITRQTFYYHFEDVFDLLDWIIRQDMNALLERTLKQEPEEALKCFFQFALERKPLFRGGMNSGYREALECILVENLRTYVTSYVDRKHMTIAGVDRDLALSYHVSAIFGILIAFQEGDDLDETVRQTFLLLTGQALFEKR